MNQLKVELEGSLRVTLAVDSCPSKDGATLGPVLDLRLREKNAAPKTHAGGVHVPINSPAAYVTLGMQPTQLAGVICIRTFDAEFLVRLTRADDTTLVIPLQGLFVYEPYYSNPAKLIEVQGSGSILWHASGPLTA